MNTGRANALVEEALHAGIISELAGFTGLRREVAYGEERSRVDFRLEFADGPAYVEVKSVTLGFEGSAVAAFLMRSPSGAPSTCANWRRWPARVCGRCNCTA